LTEEKKLEQQKIKRRKNSDDILLLQQSKKVELLVVAGVMIRNSSSTVLSFPASENECKFIGLPDSDYWMFLNVIFCETDRRRRNKNKDDSW
jgi:hypothetical protein